MIRWFYCIAAAFLFIGGGLVHGYWTDRWSEDALLTDAASRLADIPMQLGDWHGKEIEVRRGQTGPGVTGCVQRSYFNSRLGATVILALVNGRPGPVSTHTPEACYGASGYQVGTRREVPIDNKAEPAYFWTADAVRNRVGEETRVRLFWAWNGGGGWRASNDARQQFTRFRYPVLHKLYVLRELSGTTSKATEKDEPCVAFLEALVPALDSIVFAADG